MLDLFNIPLNPNYDLQTFVGGSATTLVQWQTWRKPRGARMIYMFGVGGGSSGGCGLNSTTTSGGGAGGGSGAQSALLVPAFMVPDILYVQPGYGGFQPAVLVSAAVGVVGTPTYIACEPYTALVPNLTWLFANAGAVTGAAATATTGGAAGTAAAVATLANMCLAGRGFVQLLAGQSGSAGGTSTTAGVALTYPTTGLLVSGGAGGGGNNAGTSNFAGGALTAIANMLGTEWMQALAGGIAAAGATPAGNGSAGLNTKKSTFLLTGGSGGGGSTATAGGVAGGGDGAPGCGGGGAGGCNTTVAALARPGNGGPGFAFILSM